MIQVLVMRSGKQYKKLYKDIVSQLEDIACSCDYVYGYVCPCHDVIKQIVHGFKSEINAWRNRWAHLHKDKSCKGMYTCGECDEADHIINELE